MLAHDPNDLIATFSGDNTSGSSLLKKLIDHLRKDNEVIERVFKRMK